MKKLKAEEKLIYFFLIISIIIVGSTDFWFHNITARYQLVYNLGRTFNNLSLAFISSLIFYWIVVVIPENRKKRNIYNKLARFTGNVIGDCEVLILELIKASEYSPKNLKELTKNDFEQILTKIHPYGNSIK